LVVVSLDEIEDAAGEFGAGVQNSVPSPRPSSDSGPRPSLGGLRGVGEECQGMERKPATASTSRISAVRRKACFKAAPEG
jgi:hypothetical protein